MKKVFAIMITAAMLLSLIALPVIAANVDPVVDGVITEGEYATVFEMKPDNVKTWTGGTLDTTITYYLNAPRDTLLFQALFVGIVIPVSGFNEGDMYQIAFNPGNIPDDQQSLFVSFVVKDGALTILQHNWETKLLEDSNPGGADITDLIPELILVKGDENVVIEARLPQALFTIGDDYEEGTGYKFSETMKLGLFAVIKGQGYTTLPNTPTEWTVSALGINDNEVKIMKDAESAGEHTVVEGAQIDDFYDAGGKNMSFDTFFVNRVQLDNIIMEGADGGASAKLEEYGREIDGREDTYENFTFRGWAGFESEMTRAGYQIDEEDPVFLENAFKTTEAAVKGAGGNNASRLEIEVDVTGLQDGRLHEIRAVVELKSEDEEISYAYLNMEETNANMQFYYQAPGDPPAPTETPVPAATAEPTEAPKATDVPAPATQAPDDATAAPATENSSGNNDKDNNDNKDSKGGLPTGAIVGIVAGCVAVAAVIIGIVVAKKKKK